MVSVLDVDHVVLTLFPISKVCGLWHPETVVLPGNFRDAVQCKGSIKADRFNAECEVCHLTHGAVVKCSHGHCQVWNV